MMIDPSLDALTPEMVLFTGSIGLIVIGTAGLVLGRHLFRMLLALAIAEAGVNLLLVLTGFRGGAIAPILGFAPAGTPMVDPIPQVLVLTAIVIGVGVQALAVAVMIRVYRAYRVLDVVQLRQRLESDICDAAGIPTAGSLDEPLGGRPLPPVPAPRPVGAPARRPIHVEGTNT